MFLLLLIIIIITYITVIIEIILLYNKLFFWVLFISIYIASKQVSSISSILI
jgi:hypothetical protein